MTQTRITQSAPASKHEQKQSWCTEIDEFVEFMKHIEKRLKRRLRYAIRKPDGSLLEENGWPLLLQSSREAKAKAKRLRGATVDRYADYVPETRGRRPGRVSRFKGNAKLTKSLGLHFKAGPELDEAIDRARVRYLFLPPARRPQGFVAWMRFFRGLFDSVFSSWSESGKVVAIPRRKRVQMRILTQEIQRRAREIERKPPRF